MLDSARLIAFVPSGDLERSKAFYAEVLGLRFLSQDPFAVVLDGNGTMLRIAQVSELRPAKFTVLGFGVGDIRQQVAALQAKGITCERYPACRRMRWESGTCRAGPESSGSRIPMVTCYP